ncbi:MAG TPA: ThiF family adenylyltransferase [Chthonomonadaceae bacterium]|nr:ThiF family adenylyltransferase [Chthonomonadaceae bacterium]
MNLTSALFHEQRYRSEEAMRRLRDLAVTVCGAGALGANLVESLARQGFARLSVIDRDRVEERNLSTQPYYRSDVGAFKAKILANTLYRALGVSVEARTEELTSANAEKLLRGSGLVVDTFDNSVARQAVKDACDRLNLPCLHAGLAGDYAEIIWNEVYRVPSAANDDVCDYPLARNLVLLAVAVVCETVVAFAASGARHNYTVTLGDFAVRPYEVSS